MFEKIENLLTDLIKENVKVSTTFKKPDFSTLPLIHISCNNFSLEELMGTGAKKKQEKEKFEGNGNAKEFKLKNPPLKPLKILLDGKEIKEDEYVIDNINGILKFRDAPQKDTEIFVEYYIAENVAEIHEVLAHLTYNLSIYSKNRSEVSDILLNTISTIMTKRRELFNEGITIKMGKGENADILDEDICGVKMEINIDEKFSIEVPVPKIEKIKIIKK